MMKAQTFLLFLLLWGFPGLPAQGSPERGISQETARRRARLISSLRYRLSFRLERGARTVRGRAVLAFRLRAVPSRLILDFGGKSLGEVRLNGVPLAKPLRRADHLVLPGKLLRRGENLFSCVFTAVAAPTGAPVTVYRNEGDGKEFWYTLLVPADAHRLFPCFDQPDLKGRFTLELQVPREWVCLSNAPAQGPPLPGPDGTRLHRFQETRPLSTYLFAFAAGPFAIRRGPSPAKGLPPMRLFFRPSKEKDLEADLLFRRHRECLALYGRLFGRPYPFGKLDFVLVPGFPYGGMEHAGAIFYRETALCFDHPPSAREKVRRSTVIYHEVSHQWFGNLVTMRWFDDLWLKEGFANLMSYYALDRLQPGRRAWTRFHQDLTARALAMDVTRGTTAVYQPLGNLDDAKSNYGPIVYDKAPALLKALLFSLGEEVFFRGIRIFLARRAWGCAGWRDLLSSLEEAGAGDLSRWAAWWLLRPGPPLVRPRIRRDPSGRILSLELVQSSPQGWWEGGWPSVVDVALGYTDGRIRVLRARLEGPAAPVDAARGLPFPRWVLPAPMDRAYGLFLPDLRGAAALMGDLPGIADPLIRSRGYSSLWSLFRRGGIHPWDFLEFSLRMVETERDPSSRARLLDFLSRLLDRFLPPPWARRGRARAAALVRELLVRSGGGGDSLPLARFLIRTGGDLALCRMFVEGRPPLPGLEPGKKDVFLAAAALLAAGAWKGADLRRFAAGFGKEEGGRYLYLARAASPDPAVKAEVFRSYLDPSGPPERWVSESLSWFHWPGQEKLTFPFLRPALEKVEWVKVHRKIFFMPAWIDAFVNGHSSRAALDSVEAFLRERPGLARDVRLKILQSLDRLERAVEVREKWGRAAPSRPGPARFVRWSRRGGV